MPQTRKAAMDRRQDAAPVVINKTEEMFGLSDQDFPSASKINCKFSWNQLKKWKILANRHYAEEPGWKLQDWEAQSPT